MRPLVVIELLPRLDRGLGFGSRHEPFPIETLAPQLAIERFHKAVFPGFSRGDEGRTDLLIPQPGHHRCRRELRPVIGTDVPWLAI